MPQTYYEYDKTTDVDAGEWVESRLEDDIAAAGLPGFNGFIDGTTGDKLKIGFADALSAPNKTTLDGLVKDHEQKAGVGTAKSFDHPPARAATTGALPANTRSGSVLTADANGALPAQDGVTLVRGDILLVKDEATGADNGPHVVTQVGDASNPYELTRTVFADTSFKMKTCMQIPVEEGTVNGGYVFTLTTIAPITLNTTALTFRKGPVKNDSGTTTDDILSASEIDARIAAAVAGLYDHKGGYNAATNTPDLDTSPSGVKKGDAYTVTVGGIFFGVEDLGVGDVIIADQDDPTLISHWTRVQANVFKASTTVPGIVELAEDAESAANLVPQANDSRLSDSRTPTAHAASHKHGGADEVATATPGANAIPKAGAGGKLDTWITDATTSAKGKVELATDGEAAANVAVQGNDARLSNARTPTAHALGGAEHSADTLKDLNSKVSDGTLVKATMNIYGAGL